MLNFFFNGYDFFKLLGQDPGQPGVDVDGTVPGGGIDMPSPENEVIIQIL